MFKYSKNGISVLSVLDAYDISYTDNIGKTQVEHNKAMMNKDNELRKVLEAKETEHKEETNNLNSIINTVIVGILILPIS